MDGAVPGFTKAKYHAQFPGKASFADMLLDILTVVKPNLYIMDGILAMQGQGPGSGDPVQLNLALASTDGVAMDIAVCRILNIEPVGIPILKRAKLRGLWPRSYEASHKLGDVEWIRFLLFLFRQDKPDFAKASPRHAGLLGIFSPAARGLSAEGRFVLTILLILSSYFL